MDELLSHLVALLDAFVVVRPVPIFEELYPQIAHFSFPWLELHSDVLVNQVAQVQALLDLRRTCAGDRLLELGFALVYFGQEFRLTI